MTLLVDVDGVLVTGRIPDGAHWSDGLPDAFGISPADLRAHFFAPHWAAIVTGQKPILPALTEALSAMGTATRAADLLAFWHAADARLNTDMLNWLGQQRRTGRRIMLATNQDTSRAAFLMDDLGLGAHVDGIYASATLGVAKPDPAFFAAITTAEARAPRDLILIDDTRANVDAARAAGWQAIHYTGQSLDQMR